MAAERTINPGTIVGDRFQIEQIAGTGGMGDVYRARDTATRELVSRQLRRAGF